MQARAIRLRLSVLVLVLAVALQAAFQRSQTAWDTYTLRVHNLKLAHRSQSRYVACFLRTMRSRLLKAVIGSSADGRAYEGDSDSGVVTI